MIQRIFHPIGQGAFYTEKHPNFNIVYDCGNWKRAKLADNVVKQSFKSTEVIDILFISHFDADHVNKIIVLKNHCKVIRNVILPLLHDDEKIVLVNFFKTLEYNDVASLIENPENYFDDETKVIFVEPTENPEGNEITEVNIENLQKSSTEQRIKISSYTQIFSKINNWFFVPFNYNYTTRNTELKNLFIKNGLNITQFKNDLNYALANRTKVKFIYNSLTGLINQNSMMVYSGPKDNYYKNVKSYHNNNYYFPFCHFANESNRIGCIYTGDSDLNMVNIRLVFRKYWANVGTVQIPHHGDIKCLNDAFFDGNFYICPISVGIKNTYGHPSPLTISSILLNNSIPVEVTEKLNSALIQIITN